MILKRTLIATLLATTFAALPLMAQAARLVLHVEHGSYTTGPGGGGVTPPTIPEEGGGVSPGPDEGASNLEEPKTPEESGGFHIGQVFANGMEVEIENDKSLLKNHSIPITFNGQGLLNETHEVVSIKLNFNAYETLVYYKNSPEDDFKLALGFLDDWIVPVNGKQLPLVYYQPPAGWSGEIPMTLQVLSGPPGNHTNTDEEFLIAKVQWKVNGISWFTPDNAWGYANERINLYSLNLNFHDQVFYPEKGDFNMEKASLEFSGLGEGATFYVGDNEFPHTYSNGVYILTGILEPLIAGSSRDWIYVQYPDKGSYPITASAYTNEFSVADGSKLSPDSERVTAEFTLEVR